jgi:hypothetical protein
MLVILPWFLFTLNVYVFETPTVIPLSKTFSPFKVVEALFPFT